MTPSLPSSLAGAGPAALFLVLLAAGHFLGDFLFQTGRMIRRKGEIGVLAHHAAVVTLVHLVLVAPFLSGPVVVAVLAIGVSHALIDGIKARWPARRRPGPLGLFLADQAAHLAVILGAWLLLRDAVAAGDVLWLSEGTLPGVATIALVASAFAFVANGGSGIVEGVLAPLAVHMAPDAGGGIPGSGRLIGIVERTLALILILFGQWAAMVLLVAAKSIARFEELKDRRFAEYYLVGTLASLLVAVLTGLALRVVVG